MKKKLNIAIFHLAFVYSGGGEKLVLEEIKGLQKKGHKVDCYVPTMEKELCFPDLINKYPIKVLFPSLNKYLGNLETIKLLLTCLLFPFIVYKFRKYDVVFGANQPGPFFGWVIRILLRKPYIIYLAQPTRILYPRKIDLEDGFWVKAKTDFLPFIVRVARPIFSWVDRKSIKGADKVLVNGEYMTRIINGIYDVKAISCPAGANMIKKPAKDRWTGNLVINGIKIYKPYLLVTNRHFPQKRFEYAINSMPNVWQKLGNVSLIITGSPTKYTKQLIMLTKKTGFEEGVIFTGYVTEKELHQLYKNAAVYLYTSPEEDFGMGVIEAMAARVPVVAWNKAGPSTTVLNNKTGFLVKPYLQKTFRSKILYLLQNKEANYKMGSEAVKLVRERYTYRQHINIVEKHLLKISKIE
jgi:glycosyltransferase involved in cell wall biosynthesis